MAYLGAQPNKTLTKTTSQSFNGTGSATTFTLNRAVNTEEELEVFVENVQQEPGSGKSYTAAGTTLTFDEAPPSGTGNVYVIYRGLAEVTTRLEHDANQALSATTGTFTGDLTVDTNTLFVDSTNNEVGIGTTSPTKKLSASIGLNDTDGLALEYSGENKGGILLNPAGGEVRMGALNSTGTYFTTLYSNNSEAVRVTSGGNVGINTSSPSGANLEIFTGSTTADGLKINRYSSGVYYSTLRQDTHGLAFRVGNGSAIAERAAITPNGITFNGDTASANALDDYEVGTWTPTPIATYSNPTITNISGQSGSYVRVGKQVSAWFSVTFTSNAGGNIGISGLPFSVSGASSVCGGARESASTGNWFQCEGLSGSQITVLRRYQNGNVHNGTNLMIGFVIYQTS